MHSLIFIGRLPDVVISPVMAYKRTQGPEFQSSAKREELLLELFGGRVSRRMTDFAMGSAADTVARLGFGPKVEIQRARAWI